MTPTIGLLGCYLSGSYEGTLVAAACRATARHGGRFLGVRALGLLGDDGLSATSEDLGELSWSCVDGWIGQCSAASASYLRAIQGAGKPIVMVGNDDPGVDCPKILSDNRTGIQQAVEHLIGHGHTRIAFVGWLHHFDIRERLTAYQEALKESGIEPDPSLVYPCDNNFEHGALGAARQLISQGLPCTAIMAGTDLNAVGLISALNQAGYLVPRDVAVVGFDDKPDAALLSPSLTTVSQGPGRLGETAAELLIRMVEGQKIRNGRHLVPTSLVVRQSCGCGTGSGSTPVASPVDASLTSEYYYLRQTLRAQTQVALSLLRNGDPSSLEFLSMTGADSGVLAIEETQALSPGRAGPEAFSALRVVASFGTDLGAAAGQGDAVLLPGNEFPLRGLLDQMPEGHAACVFPFRGSFGPRGVLVTVQQLGPEIEDETVFMWSHIFNELMEHRAVLNDLKNKSEELADAYALLRERALHDELTGLANRRFFRERLSQMASTSTSSGSHPYAVLWMDVDNFKSLNDSLGHGAGDSVLVEVANRLRANVRGTDLAARLGGDEFVVLVDASSPQVLDALVDRLARALNEPYSVEGSRLPVTVSIGMAFGGPEHTGPDDILREADMAMYQAKLTRSGAIVRAGH